MSDHAGNNGITAAAPGGQQDLAVRDRLLEAAAAVFAQKGYAGTSVREIVDAAGVAKPALYYYFGSKEGLYLALLQEAFREFESTITAALAEGGTVRARVHRVFGRLFALIRTNLDVVRLFHSVYYGPPQGAPSFDFEVFHMGLVGTIRGLVEEGMASGELRQGKADDVAWALNGVFDLAHGLELCHADLCFGHEGLSRVLDVVFDGIAAPAAGKERTS